MIPEAVHPTRMELLELGKRIKLAEKGHKLLSEKRDSLVAEFFRNIEEAKRLRRELAERLRKAWEELRKLEAAKGFLSLELAASSTPEAKAFRSGERVLMGVRLPEIQLEDLDKALCPKPTSPAKLEALKRDFEAIVKKLVVLVSVEEGLRRLGEEIKKTKRRVNALEYVLIPKLRYTYKYIKMRLEEMERENFLRLKRLKARG